MDVNAVLDSLDLNLEQIVVNLFYLNAREINVYEAKDAHLFGEKEVSMLLSDSFTSFSTLKMISFWRSTKNFYEGTTRTNLRSAKK